MEPSPPPRPSRALPLGQERHLRPRPSPSPAPLVPLQEAADLAREVAPQAAAEAAWACEVLGLPTPPPLAAAARGVPFRLHVRAAAAALDGHEGGHAAREGSSAPAAAVAGGAAKTPRSAKRAHPHSKQARTGAASGTGGTGAASGAAAAEAAAAAAAALEAVTALVAELPLRRDEIASGSAAPSQERVLEDRATCWLSDSGHAFDYAGKRMAPAGPLSGRTAAARRRVGSGLLGAAPQLGPRLACSDAPAWCSAAPRTPDEAPSRSGLREALWRPPPARANA